MPRSSRSSWTIYDGSDFIGGVSFVSEERMFCDVTSHVNDQTPHIASIRVYSREPHGRGLIRIFQRIMSCSLVFVGF